MSEPRHSWRNSTGSILYPEGASLATGQPPQAPEFFRDLNLDQVVATVTRGREEYDLDPFFHAPLTDPDAITYRQEVMQDLERPAAMRMIRSFAERTRAMRAHLATAGRLTYAREKQRWFLSAAGTYFDAVERLLRDLLAVEARSRGLVCMRDYLASYVASPAYLGPASEGRRLASDLARIRYGLLIRGNAVTVRNSEGEPDYSAAVEATFEKFRRGAVEDYRVKFSTPVGLNDVEARILDRVARLNPETFARLEAYCAQHADLVDPTVARFDREVQFYVAYLGFVDRIRGAGLNFCYPQVSRASKQVSATAAFDAALASKLVAEGGAVVCNDFVLSGEERILVVTGPNHGGKTTFARMYGQLHYLASLGCPVPAAQARLFLCDRLFTHFEKEEGVETGRGKLLDDLVRIRRILDRATPDSIVIMNEIFSSTTLRDASYLSRKVVERIAELGLLAVCVSFLTELASLGERTVSVVSSVDRDDPTVRTYRIERRPADGLAHAVAIAAKHRVTYERLMERIKA